ncbi:uncharacterized protein LOC111485221 [Cucurbita maxima]|uniref:Uncharacterized protein LOC111485221 n=1 Tax=Cucurbita maxima TaxID=3661 RepID=A0A6J1JF99_CUCMA|nr:uncharacterized protein LOC111485221 [Cucurbita maxima]XP_022987772.1 uncharacterized protein LOC111485221 [Cucurbita maxima]XP_022987773.1 uncharacterized protein LOC111485221 [Cucurbita maxima]
MPKERRDRSASHDRYRASPFSCSSSHARRSSPKLPLGSEDNLREWEEVRCPVCMEHPHNAVLLICSSHEKGCRPYMCDTSRRHSNCLDQFCKLFSETSSIMPVQEEVELPTVNSSLPTVNSSPTLESEPVVDDTPDEQTEGIQLPVHPSSCENQMQPKLVCPLCRGRIKKWVVDEHARQFMNAKPRSCSCETCNFSGPYTDLRKHARKEHPLVRPSEVDPERQHNWRRLERQRDLGDLLSTLQSSFGEDRVDDSILPIDDGGWLTVFFLIRVFRPESSRRSSSWSNVSRARGQPSFRRRTTRLWGESYDGEIGSSSRDEDNDTSDDGSGPLRRHERVQRQTTPDNAP